jgi:hypothetical protein
LLRLISKPGRPLVPVLANWNDLHGPELDYPNDNVANGSELAADDVTFPTE